MNSVTLLNADVPVSETHETEPMTYHPVPFADRFYLNNPYVKGTPKLICYITVNVKNTTKIIWLVMIILYVPTIIIVMLITFKT
jgi:hypothetical protein